MVPLELRENLEQGEILVLMAWLDELDTEDPQDPQDPLERQEPEASPAHPELMDIPVEMEPPEHPDIAEIPVTLVPLELRLTGMETLDPPDLQDRLDHPVMHRLDLPDPLDDLVLRDLLEMLVHPVSLERKENVELTDLMDNGLEEIQAVAEKDPQEPLDLPELLWIRPMPRQTSILSTPRPCSHLRFQPAEPSQDGPISPRVELTLPRRLWKDSVAVTLEPLTDPVPANLSVPVVLVLDSSRFSPMLSVPMKCARSMVTITVFG